MFQKICMLLVYTRIMERSSLCPLWSFQSNSKGRKLTVSCRYLCITTSKTVHLDLISKLATILLKSGAMTVFSGGSQPLFLPANYTVLPAVSKTDDQNVSFATILIPHCTESFLNSSAVDILSQKILRCWGLPYVLWNVQQHPWPHPSFPYCDNKKCLQTSRMSPGWQYYA